MATSWIRPIHNSGSLAVTLRDRTAYVKDPNKTEDYEFVAGFGCNPQTAANEFLLCKRRYEKLCKRSQGGKHDVVAYHVRVSFPPGEVTPGEVLEIGQEIADSWLKGKHQYIVAAHTNTNNPHCHIIYNSTTIDCRRKFRNFLFSSTALRRLCDITCLQHGLSIIEKPSKARGFNRGEYLGNNKPPTVRDQLRELIDKFIAECNSWEEFITAMVSVCEVKCGKHLAFKLPDSKKFIRVESLGKDYSAEELNERISVEKIVSGITQFPSSIAKESNVSKSKDELNLVVDIQEALRKGKGAGYENWAKLHNLKQIAKTAIWLQDNGIGSYEQLLEKSSAATAAYNAWLDKIKSAE